MRIIERLGLSSAQAIAAAASALALALGACGAFGDASSAPEALADASTSSDGAASDSTPWVDAGGPAVDAAGTSCTDLPEWRLDFSGSSLPAGYDLPATNTGIVTVSGGELVTAVTFGPTGGQGRARFSRSLSADGGSIAHVELSYALKAGPTPAQVNAEVGCTLTLKPSANPADDRRFVLRASNVLRYQWSGVAPANVAGLGNETNFGLDLAIAPNGRVVGTFSSDGHDYDASITLAAGAKSLVVECGIPSAEAGEVDAGARSYAVEVDDLRLRVCARP